MATGAAGAHFTFEISEEEDRNFRKISLQALKPYLDRRIATGIPLAVFLAMIGALVYAHIRGLLPVSTAIAAECSFLVGYYSTMVAALIAMARARKKMFRNTPTAYRSFDCRFDNDKIAVKQGLREASMPWSAVSRIQDTPSMVIIWYLPERGFFVPQRVFGTDAARASFVAWATERVTAANLAAAPASV